MSIQHIRTLDSPSIVKLKVYFVALVVSYLLVASSLVFGRNSMLMTFAIFLKLLSSIGMYRGSKSKYLLLSLLFQVANFLLVYISGTVLSNQPLDTFALIEKQSVTLQFSYMLISAYDALIIWYVSDLSTDIFLKRVYQSLAVFLISFSLLGTLAFFGLVPEIIGLMIPILELITSVVFVVIVVAELIIASKNLKY
ncbi:hypothetical protein [Erysipelothrix anatis]|uniref:hypothetical protein n=1 Tax=Erysipelothrix anatis TaxID=2683713 RepID=UPI00135C27D6|nr:hypothetical protein [Erysipelothrix anatis]